MAAEPSLPRTCEALVGLETGSYHAAAQTFVCWSFSEKNCVLSTAIEIVSYKGCFKDELVLRDLEVTAWKENEENSVLKCIMRCYDYGYKYAGLQVGLTS